MSSPGTINGTGSRPKPDLSDDARIADLKRLVEIETPTGNAVQAAKCAAAIIDIAKRLYGERVHIEEIPTGHGPLLVMRLGTGPARLALVGHYDTVHDMDTIKEQPWDCTGEGENQVILGPGTYDMKAGLIAQMYGVAEACEANPIADGVDPLDGLVLWHNPDEEHGSSSTRSHCRRSPKFPTVDH